MGITLKQDFNDYLIHHYSNVLQLGEVDLIKSLVKVLGTKYYASSHVVHKLQVQHDLQHNHNLPDTRSCEIADILFLFTDGEQMRYTFMQNKRDTTTTYGPHYTLRTVLADNVQWDLLHYRCPLIVSNRHGIPYNCLSSAILDSAATYGIFVNEYQTNTIDLSYSIARDLIPRRMKTIGTTHGNYTYDIISNYGAIQLDISGYFQVQGTTNLDEFEWAAQNMLVGTPIDMQYPNHKELCKSLLEIALTSLRNNKGNENSEKYQTIISQFARNNKIELESLENIELPYNVVIMYAQEMTRNPFVRYWRHVRDEIKF